MQFEFTNYRHELLRVFLHLDDRKEFVGFISFFLYNV